MRLIFAPFPFRGLLSARRLGCQQACQFSVGKMSRPKVMVTHPNFPDSVIHLLNEKFDLDVWPHSHPIERDQLLKRIEGAHGLFCLLTDKIDKDVLDKAGPQLKVVATMSVGYDHLDIDEMKIRGIKVGYTPGILTSSVAELTVALTLATTRRLFEAQHKLLSGGWGSWSPFWMCGDGLVGAKIGIVGMGRIGLAVTRRLIPFEVKKIMYAGRSVKPEATKLGAEFVPFNILLAESDVIILTCSLTDETKSLFGTAAFSSMKPTAVLINTSRGGIVDQDALVHALKSGQIAAAGLDVMTPEPLPTDHELTKLSNCVLIPHIGSATTRTRTDMAMITTLNIVSALEDRPMPAQLC